MQNNIVKIMIDDQNTQIISDLNSHRLTLELFEKMKDGTERKLENFALHHGKYMHLALFHENGSTFAHLHPIYNKDKNVFTIDLNFPKETYDDQDQIKALTKAGKYFGFADVKTEDDRIMRMIRFQIEVKGQNKLNKFKLSTQNGTTFSSYSNGKGDVASKGAFYKIETSYSQLQGQGGINIEFVSKIFKIDPVTKKYKLMNKPKKWLHAGCHIAILSHTDQQLKNKVYKHLHAQFPVNDNEIGTSSEYYFSFFNRLKNRQYLWADGEYVIWHHFKIEDKLLKIPVVINYDRLYRFL